MHSFQFDFVKIFIEILRKISRVSFDNRSKWKIFKCLRKRLSHRLKTDLFLSFLIHIYIQRNEYWIFSFLFQCILVFRKFSMNNIRIKYEQIIDLNSHLRSYISLLIDVYRPLFLLRRFIFILFMSAPWRKAKHNRNELD